MRDLVSQPVSMKVTDTIVEHYLNCKYKAHLTLRGDAASSPDYRTQSPEERAAFISSAESAFLRQHGQVAAPRTLCLTSINPGLAPLVILNVTAEDDLHAFHFHGLLRVSGKSAIGQIHYLPVLFSERESITGNEALLLAAGASILGRVQGRVPTKGMIFYGSQFKAKVIQLDRFKPRAERVLADLRGIIQDNVIPALFLNKHCAVCPFQAGCRETAVAKGDLSLLRGITERRIERYHRKGIFTIEQLSYTFRRRRRNKRFKSKAWPHSFELQALALREKKVYVLNRPSMPPAQQRVFIDMEGDPHGGSVYLIGVLVVEGGDAKQFSFWADNGPGESALFRDLLDLLDTLPEAHLFYYGSYESRAFERILRLCRNASTKQLIRARSTNVLSTIYTNVYFPTYSRSLKEIGGYFGCVWSTPGATGIHTLGWRREWERTHDVGIKDKLLQYNFDDCCALRAVTEFLYSLVDGVAETSGDRSVRDVESLAEPGPYGKDQGWGRKLFVNDDFRRVQECSYFDYQRDRVYFRTNRNIPRLRRRKVNNVVTVRHRPNKIVELTAKRCPHCGSDKVTRDANRHHVRQLLDLHFLPSGIRRYITECRSPFHECGQCKQPILAPSYKYKERYGHGLLAWSMDQHVDNRITFQGLAKTAEACFGLSASYRSFRDIRRQAARYYKSTYNRIVRKIVSGGLVHADETKILLQHTSGYVWVLSNMEEVVFFYRPSREADFLKTLLKGFTGVLVTDFYPAYDPLPFRQQKCLVHFMRDLNGDILGNPLDEEIKAIGAAFGKLMRAIVDTVDRFGLRAKYLRRHKRAVRAFIKQLKRQSVSSAVASKYRNRVLKYQEEMFAFLDFDGVPWNNNNAEHAIRHLAEYRKHMSGHMMERGLSEYLVLLSIHQTCRYRNIRFLDFLRSKSRDIDQYCSGRKRAAHRRTVRLPMTDRQSTESQHN
jgi:predicted RecB family nuclease